MVSFDENFILMRDSVCYRFSNFINSVLEMIKEEGPFTALGFFAVDKSTFVTIIGCTINYLVIMLSFNTT